MVAAGRLDSGADRLALRRIDALGCGCGLGGFGFGGFGDLGFLDGSHFFHFHGFHFHSSHHDR